MHAWLCENPIGVDALVWKELPTPEPQAGEVRVAIRAASLNFPDLLIVQNKYQFKPPLPFVPGSEYAGVVDAVGAGVTHLKPGDAGRRVRRHRRLRDACAASMPRWRCRCRPASRSTTPRRSLLTYGTTHHALLDRGALQAGETVLVLGAAGGVGTAAIQIAQGGRRARDRRRVERREVRAVPASSAPTRRSTTRTASCATN